MRYSWARSHTATARTPRRSPSRSARRRSNGSSTCCATCALATSTTARHTSPWACLSHARTARTLCSRRTRCTKWSFAGRTSCIRPIASRRRRSRSTDSCATSKAIRSPPWWRGFATRTAKRPSSSPTAARYSSRPAHAPTREGSRTYRSSCSTRRRISPTSR